MRIASSNIEIDGSMPTMSDAPQTVHAYEKIPVRAEYWMT
jgi:hypothetical protein